MFKILILSLLSISNANAFEIENVNITEPVIDMNMTKSIYVKTKLDKILNNEYLDDLNQDKTSEDENVELNDTIESQINSGEICKKNELGIIICNSLQNITEEAEPELARGALVWEDIFPIVPAIPMDLKFCLKKKEHVLANFENAVHNKNINGIIEAINWKGQSINYSYLKIEELEKNIGDGYWQKSNIINWNGPVEKIQDYPIYLRWLHKNNENEYYFTMIKIDECWFLEIQNKPNDLIEIEGVYSEGRIIPSNLIIE